MRGVDYATHPEAEDLPSVRFLDSVREAWPRDTFGLFERLGLYLLADAGELDVGTCTLTPGNIRQLTVAVADCGRAFSA